MKWTSLNDLREAYLSFFESKDHLRLKSFSLVPNNDKSLLLINSGMAPMKKYFTGELTPPRKRVTTCQKCIRTPDIECVGHTARHGTYFEMLGNFSFGDYFKTEAVTWAWEFLTKTLEIPEKLLWVSIYEKDDEAFDIWTQKVGVPAEKIVRLGKADNFWEHGSGPCGPCSEIYFDRGEKYGCGSPDCGVGCECDRYIEIWNNVFSQFNNDGKGNYTELKNKNIDTGMGLERLACVMQGVDNLFEVDTVQNIMKHISTIAGVEYKQDEKTDVSLRVITDHIRSTTFMISDGVLPSNNGRGYVLRRLLRRAARHGRLLGIKDTFLHEVVDTVINENLLAYPELADKKELIKKIIQVEEESFAKTVGQGMQLLENEIKASKDGIISGETAFKLQDTYGFPIDLTVEICADKGVSVDREKFSQIYEQYRNDTREASANAGADAWKNTDKLPKDLTVTNFVGYTEFENTAKVVAILKDGELADSLSEGDNGVIVLDTTCFYAESGGQIGDKGVISNDACVFNVEDTKKTQDSKFMHIGEVTSGQISVGEQVDVKIDAVSRKSIMRNHTAAHLLQAALRQVLGTHVEQAGQLVSENLVRFDFTHFSALTSQQLKQVEDIVNDAILEGLEVTMTEMPIQEAKNMGAMALFGEKYSDLVRVVNAKGFSIELCGGTHVNNTSALGLFRILSEGSVAAGVRRIEAVTGKGVLEVLEKLNNTLNGAVVAAKVSGPDELVGKINSTNEEIRVKNSKIDKLNDQIANIKLESILEGAKDVNGVKVISAKYWGDDASAMRHTCDMLKGQDQSIVVVLALISDEKVTFAAACGKQAMSKNAHAGNIVREVAAICQGKGGGKPDSAMAGGKDVGSVNQALDAVENIVSQMLK